MGISKETLFTGHIGDNNGLPNNFFQAHFKLDTLLSAGSITRHKVTFYKTIKIANA